MLILFLPAYATTIDKIVVFGDSLSDNGNVFSVTTNAHKTIPKIPIIPREPPYYHGRFTNGQVWIEHLAQAMHVTLLDYAYGGAWAEPLIDSGKVFPYDLATQVNMYLTAAATDYHKDKHLYVIWIGNNDCIQSQRDQEYVASNIVSIISYQLEWLKLNGAKHFLILALPDLGLIPEIIAQGPEDVARMTRLSLLNNNKLVVMLDKKRQKYPDIDFVYFDFNKYFVDTIIHPDEYHLKNVTEGCYTGGYSLANRLANSEEINAASDANIDIVNNISLRTAYFNSVATGKNVCDNPDEYLFWDGVHPNRIVHYTLAMKVLDALNQSNIQGQ